jgi:N-acetylneuraminic acid mutarotase
MWSLHLDFMSNAQAAPTWNPVAQTNLKYAPGNLAHHTAVVFSNAAYFVGGIRSNGVSNTEMYKYDIPGKKWEMARQRDATPGQRDDHTCNLYDEQMILFGGYESGVRKNDLLSYKFEGFKWTKIQPEG